MDVRFVAGFAVITTDPALDKGLFVETLGLPLRPPVSVPNSEYAYSEDVAGAKHFGVWPLNEAAQACFGRDTLPFTHPVPQATIEFEVDDVETARAGASGPRLPPGACGANRALAAGGGSVPGRRWSSRRRLLHTLDARRLTDGPSGASAGPWQFRTSLSAAVPEALVGNSERNGLTPRVPNGSLTSEH